MSVDSKNSIMSDIRYVYSAANPQPTCMDLATFVNNMKESTKSYADVNCIEKQ